ncbi:MAG: gliding motility protein GldM [Bacteroidota bacterium]
MSIPKEPRQLMINLMYLVLTALLALSVSAEIISAFESMDDSITESNLMMGSSNAQLLTDIRLQAEAYQQYEPLHEKAMKAHRITQDFAQSIDQLKAELIEAAGGLDEKGEIKKPKENTVTTNLFVNEGAGERLRAQMRAIKDSLLQLVDSLQLREQLMKSVPLNADQMPVDSKKKTWVEHHFAQMPVAAVLPLLSKIQNDAQTTEAAVLNYFVNKLSSTNKLDSYNAIVAADKSYVIRGEELNAEIFLGAYSSTADNVEVFVDGRRLSVRDGKANLQLRPNSLGKKEMDVLIRERNPLNDDVKEYRRRFSYEVGERSVAVSADKMNVFYVGVDNPLSISVAGVPSGQIQVRGEGVTPQRTAAGKYVVRPERTGRAKIIVSGGGLEPTAFEYRIKHIPTPKVMLGDKEGGLISAGEMRVHKRLRPVLEGFDFDARCKIRGFRMVRVPRNDDPKTSSNAGETFHEKSLHLASQARPGDAYYFENLKVRCPGDGRDRKLPSLAFRIR